jgi:hypothetical protein
MTATAVAATRPDPILSLEQRLWEADEASADADTLEGAKAYERFKVLDKRMQDAVPVSLEGVAAKLRYLKWDASIAGGRTGETAAATALEGLERLMTEN